MKTFFSLLLFILVFGSASAQGFSDVPEGYPYKEAIETLQAKGVVEGYSDGTFKPGKILTRAEFLTMSMRALLSQDAQNRYVEECIEETLPSFYTYVYFPDVPVNHWAAPYVCFAKNLGIITGEGGRFVIGRHVRYAEAVKIGVLVQHAGEEQESEQMKERVVEEVARASVVATAWYIPYMETLASMADNLPTQWFPEKRMTRGEAAFLLVALGNKETPAEEDIQEDGAVERQKEKERKSTQTVVIPPASKPEPTPVTPVVDNVTDPRITTFHTTGKLQEGMIALQWSPKRAKQLKDPFWLLARINSLYSAYERYTGVRPYNGAVITIMEQCPYEQREQRNSKECPNGYMSYPAWGLAGNPISILDSGVDTIISDANSQVITFGLAHELSHTFDSGEKKYYVFNSTSAEAWANIKLVYAMDEVPFATNLNGVLYRSGEEMMSGFYRPYYNQYKEKGFGFTDLNYESPVVGNLADMYHAIIERKMGEVSRETLWKAVRLYEQYNRDIRSIGQGERGEKVNQFIFFWSAMAKKDMSSAFAQDNFTITEKTKQDIAEYLALPSAEQTGQRAVLIDNTVKVVLPAGIEEAMQQVKREKQLQDRGAPRSQGIYWIQAVTDANAEGLLVYTPSQQKAYFIPWWHAQYLEKYAPWETLGGPTREFYYESVSRTWRQDFEKGTLVYDQEKGTTEVLYKL